MIRPVFAEGQKAEPILIARLGLAPSLTSKAKAEAPGSGTRQEHRVAGISRLYFVFATYMDHNDIA
eukprot:5470372-Pleurochrysis_carterae.AAC.6